MLLSTTVEFLLGSMFNDGMVLIDYVKQFLVARGCDC